MRGVYNLSLPRITAGIIMALAASAFAFIIIAGNASAATYCPGNSTQASCACPTTGPGVTCISPQLYSSSASNCYDDPRSCSQANQRLNCNTGACVCDTPNYPCAGCTTSQTTVGGACASGSSTDASPECAENSQYTNRCGAWACPGGTTLCSTPQPGYPGGICVTDRVCPAGMTWDVCNDVCTTPYVLLAPPPAYAPQSSADVQLSGDFALSTGDLSVTEGDILMANSKAIAVNQAGASTLNFGNWDGAATGFTIDVYGTVKGDRIAVESGEEFCIGTDCITSWENIFPVGGANQTIYHDGSGWEASTALQSNGTDIAMGTGTFDGRLSVRQDGTGDIFNLYDGAANVMSVIDGGLVGIGTSSPNRRLTVNDAATTVPMAVYGSSTGSFIQIGAGGASKGFIGWTNQGDDGLGFLNSAGTANLLVTDAGNVGIGNTTPAYELDVTGDINASGEICINGNCINDWAPLYPPGFSDGDTLRYNGTTWVANTNLYNSGTRVGIGTTSPTATFHVADAVADATTGGTSGIRVGDGVTGKISVGGSGWYDDGTYFSPLGRSLYVRSAIPNTYIYSPSIYLGAWNDSSRTRLRGNTLEGDDWIFNYGGANGNTGIGTLTPTYKLDVRTATSSNALNVIGRSYFTGDSITLNNDWIYLGMGSSDTIVANASNMLVNNGLEIGNVLYIDENAVADKRVGIGGIFSAASRPQYNLDVRGDAYVSEGLTVDGKIIANGGLQLPTGATDGYALVSDASGNASWQSLGGIGGGGTPNYVAKFSATSTLADSSIIDDGTGVNITVPVGINGQAPSSTVGVRAQGSEMGGYFYNTVNGRYVNLAWESPSNYGVFTNGLLYTSTNAYIYGHTYLGNTDADVIMVRAGQTRYRGIHEFSDYDAAANVGMVYDAPNMRLGIGSTTPQTPMHLKAADGIKQFRLEGDTGYTEMSQSGQNFTFSKSSNSGSVVWTGSTGPASMVVYIGSRRLGVGSNPTGVITGKKSGTFDYMHLTNVTDGDVLTVQNDGDMSVDGSTFFVDAVNNRVGIGTTSPSNKLTVAQSADSDGIRIYGYDDQSGAYLRQEIDVSGYSNIDSSKGFRLKQAGSAIAFVSTASTEGFRLYDDIPMSFGTIPTERFQIGYESTSDTLRMIRGTSLDTGVLGITMDSSGDVGIGTTNPLSKLHVSGGGSTALTVFNNSASRTINVSNTGTGETIYAKSWGGIGARIIGTADEALFLSSEYSSNNVIEEVLKVERMAGGVGASGIGAGISFSVESSVASAVGAGQIAAILTDPSGSSPNSSFVFRTVFNGTEDERVRITDTGRLGIGTTNPGYTLDVNGTANVTGFRMPTGATDGYALVTDATGNASWQSLGGISGGGTANRVSKFTAGSTLGDSSILDTGSLITVDVPMGVNGQAPNAAYGIRAEGSTMGAMFKDKDNTQLAYLGYQTYGLYTTGHILTTRNSYLGDGSGDLVMVRAGETRYRGVHQFTDYDAPTSVGMVYDAPNMRLGIGTTSPATSLHVSVSDSLTTGSIESLRLERVTSAGSPAGIGQTLDFWLDNSTSTPHEAAEIDVGWSVSTAGAEDSNMRFFVYDGGNKVESLKLRGNNDGSVEIGGWVFGNPRLAVEADGLTYAIGAAQDSDTSAAVYATNDGAGEAVFARSSSGTAYYGQTSNKPILTGYRFMSTTNTMEDMIWLARASTSGQAAGIGASIAFATGGPPHHTIARIGAIKTSAVSGSDYDSALVFNTGLDGAIPTEKMRIDSDGNVGIGTTNPAYDLDVNGTVNVDGFRMATGATNGYALVTDASGNASWQPLSGIAGSGTTNYVSKFTSSSTLGNSSIIDTGSLVTVGVPMGVNGQAPNAGYGIRAEGSTMGGYFKDKNNTQYAYLGYSTYGLLTNGHISTYANAYLGNASTDFLQIRAGQTRYEGVHQFTEYGNTTNVGMVYDAPNARVGIGTTTPDYDLDVAGTVGVDQYIYHNDDVSNDTYINIAEDQFRFYVAGVEKMSVIKGIGEIGVGINESSPKYSLDVGGTIYGADDLRIVDDVYFGTTTNQSTMYIYGSSLDSTADITLDNADALIALGPGEGGPHGLSFGDDGAEGLQLVYRTTPNQLIIENRSDFADGTDLFSIDYDTNYAYFAGNVGLGTASPSDDLHIYKGGEAATARIESNGDSGLYLEADINNVGESDNAFVSMIQDGGSVTGVLGFTGSAGYDPEANLYSGTLANSLFLGTIGDFPMQFGTNGLVHMTFSGVNVGIGTTSPAYTLDVGGSMRTSNNAAFGGATVSNSYGVSAQGSTMGGWFYDEGGTSRTYIAYGSYGVYVSLGSAAKPGGGSWSSTSDRRTKKDISSFDGGLELVSQLSPVNYTYNGLAETPEGLEGIGFIAQDVMDVVPWMVKTDYVKLNPEDENETAVYSIDPSSLPFINLNAIKELKEMIEEKDSGLASFKIDVDGRVVEVEAVVKELQDENETLKARMDELEGRLQQAEWQLLQD